ncbi:chemotaxis-specific protein-glutamate methyltransferase CheB [Pseudochelatococcus lubricantis]|uniref:chemotaxis-specific protein-glutamate methyltransferase CheB n=1 Tax=Pseudochelatococcus lubricantis TaxID=1538102 RepID=UPI001FE4259F|nr:chemotaxis-specific protein-glutamate methyltransferase CheB [Pseudochelatococcus lubricantis]
MPGLSVTRDLQTGAGSDDIRVMIVDDSAVIRGLTARWIAEAAGVAVVATHANGRKAVEDVAISKPDVVILDIEMPEMDGLTALPLLLERHPGVVVIVSSTLSRRGAEISLRALSLGAAECIAKPDGSGRIASAAEYRRELFDMVTHLGARARARRAREGAVAAGTREQAAPARLPPEARGHLPEQATGGRAGSGPPVRRQAAEGARALRPYSSVPPRVLALGSSTGGPQALVQVLASCREVLARVPVLVVQHMPPTFTALLAEQLGRAAGLPAAEAKEGEAVVAGRIYVAPGGLHMLVACKEDAIVARLSDTPPEHFCKPAVDPLFRSVAQVFGPAALGVVLTGMGSDGGLGAAAIAASGGSVVIQDEETSVVWGMPGAVAAAGACAGIFPLPQIGGQLRELLRGSAR